MATTTTSISTGAMTAPHRWQLDRLDTNDGLREYLDRVATEGWDGPAGRAVLAYAMSEVVKPVVRSLGIYAAAGDFAEATGWAAAWEALREPGLAEEPRPWGMVSIRVRRAVLGERMGDVYGTSAASAWRIRRFSRSGQKSRRGEWNDVADRGALQQPVSLDRLRDSDEQRPARPAEEIGPRLQILVDLLVRHGWSPTQARAAIMHVAECAPNNRPDSTEAPGWRELATDLGIPHWQARRLTVLLLGAPGWTGLAERLITGGPAALRDPVVSAAVRSTQFESMGSPPRAARLAGEIAEPVAQIAS